jgi:DeoR family transcriptional regulator, suf operon transcriptional repressor
MQLTPEQVLLGPSKNKILHLLRIEDKTASSIASTLQIQVSAARKHLEQMTSLGLATITFQKGTVGRPKKFYHLTERGREMFPRAYDVILNSLTTQLVERQGPDHAESVMRDMARDTARSLDGHDLHGNDRLKHVQKALNQVGFEANLTSKNGSITVISRNCPVRNVALKQGEIVCRGYHAELLKAALGGENVERKEWIVDGDSYCKHTVNASDPASTT